MNNNKEQQIYLYSVSFVAAIGGFLFGYDLSIISGAILFLENYFELSPGEKGFAFGSAILGSVAGPIFGMWVADRLGRKKSLGIAAACFLVSAIGTALPANLVMFNIWRFIGGIGVGLASTIAPMYIAEIAPSHLRGRLVTVNQLSIVVGINLAVIVSYFLSFGEHWRWMFASEIIPILLLSIGLFFIPRSPRWLASKGYYEEALDVLAKINGIERARVILNEIKEELKEEAGGFRELLLPGIRRAVIIGVMIMVFGQINGVNMMILYGPTILFETGIGNESQSIFFTMGVNFLILISTIIAFWLVATFGRRKIIMTGVSMMAFGHIVMASVFFLNLSPYFNLLAMVIGTSSFTLSLAPVGWVILSEIFPNRIRGKAMSIATTCLYFSSFLTTQFFPLMTSSFTDNYGSPGGAYLVFAGICISCVIFTYKMVPETKDLTLETIGRFWLHYKGKDMK